MPQSKSGHFLRKVIAYANEDNPPKRDGTTTPKHADLINSIGDIRAAVVGSFWQDSADRLPGNEASWVEVWLSSEDLGVIERFESLCQARNVQIGEGRLTLPERTVMLVLANRAQLGELIEHSDDIAEFRAAREVATFFIEKENTDQVEWVDGLLRRSEFQNVDQIVVLVLDHGVNNGHRLLEPVLPAVDCHAVNPAWGTHDHHGHGTLMAGTAAYGDLLDSIMNNRPLTVRHGLESAKILPPWRTVVSRAEAEQLRIHARSRPAAGPGSLAAGRSEVTQTDRMWRIYGFCATTFLEVARFGKCLKFSDNLVARFRKLRHNTAGSGAFM